MIKRVVLLIAVVLLCLSPLACAEKATPAPNESTKYTIYVALNDKDTHTQLISTDEAEKRMGDIALRYVDGYSMFIAAGAFKDDSGALKRETSIAAEFYFTSREQIDKIMNDVLKEFNQGVILLSTEKTEAELYPQ